METTYRKSDSGWRAETELALNFEIEDKPAFLRFETYKYSGVLLSRAGVITKDNGFTTTRLFRDFSGRFIQTRDRCTEKNVKAQHERMMLDATAIALQACQHHADLGDLVVEEA